METRSDLDDFSETYSTHDAALAAARMAALEQQRRLMQSIIRVVIPCTTDAIP